MISIPAGARVVLAIRPVEFRKGAHSLATLAQQGFCRGLTAWDGLVQVLSARAPEREAFRLTGEL